MSKLNKRMRKRMMKLFRKAEKGSFDAMMEGIELLIDTRGERYFDNGYESALSDMAVRAYRLAEYIALCAEKEGRLGKDANGEPMGYINNTDDLAKVIEEYFNGVLNNK